LYGGIPWELFSISTLSVGFDLSNNKLTGDIPFEIGGLINLNSLSLSNNLTGDITLSVAAVTMPCVAVIILKKRRKGKQLTNQSLKKLKNFLTAHKNTLASYSYRS